MSESEIINAACAVADRVRRKGTAQTDAVRELWTSLRLSAGATKTLAQRGLQVYVSDVLHGRKAEEEFAVSVSVEPRAERVIRVNVLVLEREVYATSRGSIALINFQIQDCEEVAANLLAEASGLTRKAALIRRAKDLLITHAVNALAHLPDSVLREFAQQWANLQTDGAARLTQSPPQTQEQYDRKTAKANNGSSNYQRPKLSDRNVQHSRH